MIELRLFLYFLGLSETYYNLQSFLITLYDDVDANDFYDIVMNDDDDEINGNDDYDIVVNDDVDVIFDDDNDNNDIDDNYDVIM